MSTTSTTNPLKQLVFGHVSEYQLTAPYRNLFLDHAIKRIAAITGWATALSHLPEPAYKQIGERMLADLDKAFKYLNEFGGNHEDTNIPRFLFVLGDGGSLHNFTVAAYQYIPDDQQYKALVEQNPRGALPREYRFRAPEHNYYYSFNGGLIYTGPMKTGQDFTCKLVEPDDETCWWGLNT